MPDDKHAEQPDGGSVRKPRSARFFRAMVLCALAGAPAACGPATGPVEEPRPAADAGAENDAAALPAYGVPVEPDQPVVSEYAVVEHPEPEIVMYYGAPHG